MKPATQPVHWRTVLKIAAAFAAYLIGSGFATGQEAMQFFAAHGLAGLAGVALSLVCFSYICLTLFSSGRIHQLSRNEDVFRYYCGDYLGVFLTWYTMIFIVAVHAVMLAGAGAAIGQTFQVSGWPGSLVMGILVAATLILGLKQIVSVMSLIGPIVIALTVTTALGSLALGPSNLLEGAQLVSQLDVLKASDNWASSALLYVGLTMLGLASFLPALGTQLHNHAETRATSVIGPLLFCSALFCVVAALIKGMNSAQAAEVPMLALAGDLFLGYEKVLALLIFLSIFTTATPLLWTVAARLGAEGTPRYRVWVIALSCAGLAGTFALPFGKLVNLIYPTVGWAGLTFLVCAVIHDIRRLVSNKQ